MAAHTAHGEAWPRPDQHDHGCRLARADGDAGRATRRGPRLRYVSRQRRRWSAPQQDRERRAAHAPAERPHRALRERALTGVEQGDGEGDPARQALATRNGARSRCPRRRSPTSGRIWDERRQDPDDSRARRRRERSCNRSPVELQGLRSRELVIDSPPWRSAGRHLIDPRGPPSSKKITARRAFDLRATASNGHSGLDPAADE